MMGNAPEKPDKMIKAMFMIRPEHDEQLRASAYQLRTSKSELVRRALDLYFKEPA